MSLFKDVVFCVLAVKTVPGQGSVFVDRYEEIFRGCFIPQKELECRHFEKKEIQLYDVYYNGTSCACTSDMCNDQPIGKVGQSYAGESGPIRGGGGSETGKSEGDE